MKVKLSLFVSETGIADYSRFQLCSSMKRSESNLCESNRVDRVWLVVNASLTQEYGDYSDFSDSAFFSLSPASFGFRVYRVLGFGFSLCKFIGYVVELFHCPESRHRRVDTAEPDCWQYILHTPQSRRGIPYTTEPDCWQTRLHRRAAFDATEPDCWHIPAWALR